MADVLNRDEVLTALRTVSDVPSMRKGRRRTIYEAAVGGFYLDYAGYAGGRTEQVPLSVIRELENQGIIVRAFPEAPKANAWALKSDHEQTDVR